MAIAIMPPCFLSKSRVSKCWIDIEIGIHRKGSHENSKKNVSKLKVAVYKLTVAVYKLTVTV